jgi:hypothetical protein
LLLLDPSLEAFGRLGELLTSVGGKRYVPDWLSDMGEEGWRRHWGLGPAWAIRTVQAPIGLDHLTASRHWTGGGRILTGRPG